MMDQSKNNWNKGMLVTSGTKSASKPKRKKPPQKTPLQSFDIRGFFEENLADIIDLEENRSGVREFEEAVKKNE